MSASAQKRRAARDRNECRVDDAFPTRKFGQFAL
jgi:hypothetical protein